MKTIIVLAMVLAVALTIPADTYNPKYDNFDAKEVVANERLIQNYMSCFLGEGRCTPEGTEFSKIIPEALQTKCAKCTPKQKEHIREMCLGFKAQLPEKWEQLVQKYDPKGEYKQFMEDFLAA